MSSETRKKMIAMFGPWYQIYIKQFKSGQALTPEYAKRIDAHLVEQTSAAFVAPPPEGIPIVNEDGEFEVRCFAESSLGFVRFILTDHYGLAIEREVKNDG